MTDPSRTLTPADRYVVIFVSDVEPVEGVEEASDMHVSLSVSNLDDLEAIQLLQSAAERLTQRLITRN